MPKNKKPAAKPATMSEADAILSLVGVLARGVIYESSIAANILRDTLQPLWNERLNECERLLADVSKRPCDGLLMATTRQVVRVAREWGQVTA